MGIALGERVKVRVGCDKLTIFIIVQHSVTLTVILVFWNCVLRWVCRIFSWYRFFYFIFWYVHWTLYFVYDFFILKSMIPTCIDIERIWTKILHSIAECTVFLITDSTVHVAKRIKPCTISSLIFCSSCRMSAISSCFIDSRSPARDDDVTSADEFPAAWFPANRPTLNTGQQLRV